MGNAALIAILVVQVVFSIFGAHFSFSPTMEVSFVDKVLSNSWVWSLIAEITGNPVIEFIGDMQLFSYKMYTFSAPGVPEFFSWLWVAMGLAIGLIIYDKVRGISEG